VSTYVLVHGAWSGGWGWTKVAGLIRAAGHEVFVPTLTGLGERSHLLHPGITLSTHIQDVLGVFSYEDLKDVILVGHSYGGMVITGVSGRIADRIRTLVYLDAFVPQNGQSLADLNGNQAALLDAQREAPGMISPMEFATKVEDAELAELRRRKLGPHPLLTLTEAVKLDGSELAIPNRTYIWATQSPGFQRFHDGLQSDAAWKVKTIDTGHVVMLEEPEGLAALLLEEG
jgi:pimeloyl-ACP methyl ester carboxylesterase